MRVGRYGLVIEPRNDAAAQDPRLPHERRRRPEDDHNKQRDAHQDRVVDLRILRGCSSSDSLCAGATPRRNIGRGFTGGPDGAGKRFTPVCSRCLCLWSEKGPGSCGNCFLIEGRGGPCNLTSP